MILARPGDPIKTHGLHGVVSGTGRFADGTRDLTFRAPTGLYHLDSNGCLTRLAGGKKYKLH